MNKIPTKNGTNTLRGYEILIPPTQPAVYTAKRLVALAMEHPEIRIDLPETDHDKIRLLSDSIEIIENNREK